MICFWSCLNQYFFKIACLIQSVWWVSTRRVGRVRGDGQYSRLAASAVCVPKAWRRQSSNQSNYDSDACQEITIVAQSCSLITNHAFWPSTYCWVFVLHRSRYYVNTTSNISSLSSSNWSVSFMDLKFKKICCTLKSELKKISSILSQIFLNKS